MRDDSSTKGQKKLAILAALGLGLAMAARRRRWQRYAFSQMHHAGTPEGFPGAAGYGGHGPWRRGWPSQGSALPPMIDAKLRAWHEQAHGKSAPSAKDQPTQV